MQRSLSKLFGWSGVEIAAPRGSGVLKNLGAVYLVLGALLISASAEASSKVDGTLQGTIGGEAISINGTCMQAEGAFEFWSDGKGFAVNKDADGDGMYLNIGIFNFGGQDRASMRYSRDGETVYNGVLSYTAFDGQSLAVDAVLGSRTQLPATFTVACG